MNKAADEHGGRHIRLAQGQWPERADRKDAHAYGSVYGIGSLHVCVVATEAWTE